MPLPISVILCTHNPRAAWLMRVLDALRAQTFPRERWEFLLIDNASTDPLQTSVDLSWHPAGRHVREEKLGLTAARLRGIVEARGGLLVFVDDDNVLAPDFLEVAASLAAAHPHLGVFGAGALIPEYEVPPPRELLPKVALLAVREVPQALWSNHVEDAAAIPWGAGLCVRRDTAASYQELLKELRVAAVLGRRGGRLFSGEDDVFSWVAARQGQGFGLFPDLRITHLIAAGRLNRAYFVRLTRDHALSHGVLSHLRQARFRKPTWTDYPRLVLHGLKNGRFSMQCQWAELRGRQEALRFVQENGLGPLRPPQSLAGDAAVALS